MNLITESIESSFNPCSILICSKAIIFPISCLNSKFFPFLVELSKTFPSNFKPRNFSAPFQIPLRLITPDFSGWITIPVPSGAWFSGLFILMGSSENVIESSA